MDDDSTLPWEDNLRKYMSWAAVIGTSLFTAAFFFVAILFGARRVWQDLVHCHFATLIGLPAAAVAALGLVLLLRTVAGPVKFKALGFEFSGASGPIIMWVICFLAITLAIKLTWPLEFHPVY